MLFSADFLNVMDEHTTAVTDTVSLDLTYFSGKFIASGFITQTAASEVLSKLGISAGDKSRELLHLVRQNYKISLKKQVWADKFIAIFSSQAAYSDLATLLRGETSTAGVANIAISSTNCCAITPTLFISRSSDMILYWTRTVQVFILDSLFSLFVWCALIALPTTSTVKTLLSATSCPGDKREMRLAIYVACCIPCVSCLYNQLPTGACYLGIEWLGFLLCNPIHCTNKLTCSVTIWRCGRAIF